MGRHHKEHRRPPVVGVAATVGFSGQPCPNSQDWKSSVGRSKGKNTPDNCTIGQSLDLPADELVSPPEEWRRTGNRGRVGVRSRSRASSRGHVQSRASSPVGRRVGTSTPLPGTPVAPIPPLFADSFKDKVPRRPPVPAFKPDNLHRPSWIKPHPLSNDTNAMYSDKWLACADQAFPRDIMFIGSLLMTELWLAMRVLPAELYDKICVLICAVLRAKRDDLPSIIPVEVAEATIEDLWSFLRTVRLAHLDTKCQQERVQVLPTGQRIDGDVQDLLAQGFFKQQDFKDIAVCRHSPTSVQRPDAVTNRGLKSSVTDTIDSISWMAFFGVRAAISCIAHVPSVQCECPHHIRIDPCVALSHASLGQIPLDDTFNLARAVAHGFLEESLFMPVNSKGLGVLNKEGIEFVNKLAQQRSILALSSASLASDLASSVGRNKSINVADTLESSESGPTLPPSSLKQDPTDQWKATRQFEPLPGVGFVSRATKKSRTGGQAFRTRKPLPSFKNATGDPMPAIEKAEPQMHAFLDEGARETTAQTCDNTESQQEIKSSLPEAPSETPSLPKVMSSTCSLNAVTGQHRMIISTLGPSTSITKTRASLRKKRMRPKLQTDYSGEQVPHVPLLPKGHSGTVSPSQSSSHLRVEPNVAHDAAPEPTSITSSVETRKNETQLDSVISPTPPPLNPSSNATSLIGPTTPIAPTEIGEKKSSKAGLVLPTSSRDCRATAPVSISTTDRSDDGSGDSVNIRSTYHVFEDQELAIFMWRTEPFAVLLERWKAFFTSKTEHIAHRIVLPQRFMFIWKGRPLQLHETPVVVGMHHKEVVDVLDAMDVSLSLQCHEAGFYNEIMRVIAYRDLLRKEGGLEISTEGLSLSHDIARRYIENPSLKAEDSRLSAQRFVDDNRSANSPPQPRNNATFEAILQQDLPQRQVSEPTSMRRRELELNVKKASAESRLTSLAPGVPKGVSGIDGYPATSSNPSAGVEPLCQSVGKSEVQSAGGIFRPLGTVLNGGISTLPRQALNSISLQKNFPIYKAEADVTPPATPLKAVAQFGETQSKLSKPFGVDGAPPVVASRSGSLRSSASKSATLSRGNRIIGRDAFTPGSYETDSAVAHEKREQGPRWGSLLTKTFWG